VLASVAILAACSSPRGESIGNRPAASSSADSGNDPLPLVKGATFIYDVTIVFYDASTGQDATAQFPWTMTVVDVRDRHYKMTGWLDQLVDFDAKLPYRPPSPSVRDIARTETSISIAGDRWLSLPLVDGQRTCPTAASRYCWTVATDHERYKLAFVTGPDDKSYELTPGIGVTRFDYRHHGTTLQVTAKLVSHPGR
jgi:hypothetical protein